MKDLYSKNYKTLMKVIEDNTSKWKDIPCSWIASIKIVKMSIPPQTIYHFNANSIRIPMAFFTELERIVLKFAGKHKDPEYQSKLEKEEQNWRYHTP